jgi:serine/threonine protein kinase
MSAAETPSDLVSILDAYLADLHAGKAPDRAALLAAHPGLAQQLESCLAALDFIHRAERPDPTMPPTLGDFRVVREIGRGAWGVVYEAEQISLKRRVALKVLRFGGPADAEAMARFRREAETVAQLHHTNIMPIFAVGCENGVHYFAMQLIAGRSLAAVLKEAQDNKQALDPKAVCGWGVQAAEALAHAHARGVVHRDVKPSNLLLDGEGIVWLADFGLARRHDETAMTLAGAAVGTPRYMSPEQASAVAKPVDQRSDVYSLGATLYELATGRAVFEAQTVQELYRQIAESEPVSPRRVREDLPRDLETVLLKCLAKEPGQRYATAQELADDLRRVVSGDPVRARRPNVLLRLRR